jgi:hypothetical protein
MTSPGRSTSWAAPGNAFTTRENTCFHIKVLARAAAPGPGPARRSGAQSPLSTARTWSGSAWSSWRRSPRRRTTPKSWCRCTSPGNSGGAAPWGVPSWGRPRDISSLSPGGPGGLPPGHPPAGVAGGGRGREPRAPAASWTWWVRPWPQPLTNGAPAREREPAAAHPGELPLCPGPGAGPPVPGDQGNAGRGRAALRGFPAPRHPGRAI